MTETISDEPVTGEVVTGEIVPYAAASAAMEEYRPRIVMQPEEAKALDDQLRQCMKAILREGVDYGPIPGGDPDKKNLHKPGAEKLLQWFGFGSESREVKIERDDPDYPSGVADKVRRVGVTYRAEVTKTVPGCGKVVVATCEGYAGYDEDRYFITEEAAKAKAKANEMKWAKKDGRPPNSWKWENATEYRAPWNTLIKMAQKRAYVGAAIDATGAAGLFTQDMEDIVPAEPVVADPLPVIAGIAGGIIRSLPKDTLRAFDRWFKEQGFPPRTANWTAEQWCAALVGAGRLDAETDAEAASAATAATPVAALPPDDSWAVAIADVASSDEIEPLVDDLERQARIGAIPPPRVAQIRAAIEAKAATFQERAA